MLELTVRLIASLAVVVGLLLLLAKVGGRRMRGRAGSLVQVVHRQPLSRSSAVSVVTVGSRVLVLGTTEHQVTVLTELDPDELAADLVLVPGEADEDGEPTAVPVLLPAPRSAVDVRPAPTTTSPAPAPVRAGGAAGRCPAPAPARRRPPCRRPTGDRQAPAGARRAHRLGPVARDLAAGPRRRHGQGVMTRSLRASRALGSPLAAVVWLALAAARRCRRAGPGGTTAVAVRRGRRRTSAGTTPAPPEAPAEPAGPRRHGERRRRLRRPDRPHRTSPARRSRC